jgi:metal-responsive CopG/Arc/MetJ family transcriptional regulator
LKKGEKMAKKKQSPEHKILLTLTKDIIDMLTKIAEKEMMSRSAIVRRLVANEYKKLRQESN